MEAQILSHNFAAWMKLQYICTVIHSITSMKIIIKTDLQSQFIAVCPYFKFITNRLVYIQCFFKLSWCTAVFVLRVLDE